MIGKPSSLKCLMAFFMLLNCTCLIAQERVVTGKIKDPTGNPLPGVNVNVWGTRISVTADVTGTFRIPVPTENSVLVFSFVGFLQKEQKVGTDSTFTISMAYDNADLDQVVVVGYGTSKRRDLTGAVYSVKPSMVTAAPVSNAAEALQGRIPGLDIQRSSGAPGAGTTIQLRGNRTLSGTDNGTTGSSSSPLVIIDGFQGGDIGDLNPNDIESVEVLKDASSTAIYGWMGANGVIIVTTKRGKDRPKVSYHGFYGVNGMPVYPDVRMGESYINFKKEAYRTVNGTTPSTEGVLDPNELAYYQQNKWVDWYKEVVGNGILQSHTASIQSGGDKTKVFFSAGVYNEQGVLKDQSNTRYNSRLNYDQRISNVFKAGFMTQLTYQNTNSRTDPMSQISQMSPLGEAYDSTGSIRLFPGLTPSYIAGLTGGDPKTKSYLSPLTDEREGSYKWNTARGNIIANAYLEITPITGLSIRSNFGTTITYSREGQYFDSVTLANYQKGNGSTARIESEFTRFYTWDNIVTYNRKMADHSITVTGLTSYTRSDWDQAVAAGKNLSSTDYGYSNLAATAASTRTTESDYIKTTTFSYAGRLNYSYKGKYLLMGTLRADGVSRLSAGNKWDYFPSAGIGWNIHQEDFMSNVTFVNNLKIRATYGIAGNASVSAYETQTSVSPSSAIIGTGVVATTSLGATTGNTNLRWEKTSTVNMGLDFAFLKSRIFGSVDVYQSKTTDILYLRTLPYSTGLSQQWQNIGESENQGVEVALSSVNVNARNFRWTSTITFTSAREKLTKLLTNKDVIIYTNDPERRTLMIGRPIKSFYGYQKTGIWQTDENKDNVTTSGHVYEAGDIKVLDRNNDNIIDGDNDRGYMGSSVPKWYGGFQNTFSYKGFDLSVYIIARWGSTIYAEWIASHYNVGGSGNGFAEFDYWTPENPTNDFPRPRLNAKLGDANYIGYLSMNMVDGSYVKLKTLTLAYTLPVKVSRKAFIEKVRLYATGNNIWTKAKSPYLKNYDPERDGSENTPITRQFVFGANIDF